MSTSQTLKQYLATLRLLFFALVAAQIMICAILWFAQQDRLDASEFQEDIWFHGIGILTLILLFGNLIIKKKMIQNAREKATLDAKLAQYRQAQIISWALMEGASLINAVYFFLSGKLEFLYMAGVIIALFLTLFPFRAKIIDELGLGTEEQSALEDPM